MSGAGGGGRRTNAITVPVSPSDLIASRTSRCTRSTRVTRHWSADAGAPGVMSIVICESSASRPGHSMPTTADIRATAATMCGPSARVARGNAVRAAPALAAAIAPFAPSASSRVRTAARRGGFAGGNSVADVPSGGVGASPGSHGEMTISASLAPAATTARRVPPPLVSDVSDTSMFSPGNAGLRNVAETASGPTAARTGVKCASSARSSRCMPCTIGSPAKLRRAHVASVWIGLVSPESRANAR